MKGTSFRSINPIKSQEVSALGENTLSPCRNAERVTHPLISSHQTITHHLHSHTLQPCTCLNSQLFHKHVDDFFNILSSGFFHNHTDMLFFLSWKNKNKKPASYIPMLFLPLKQNFSKESSVLTVSNTSSHFFLKLLLSDFHLHHSTESDLATSQMISLLLDLIVNSEHLPNLKFTRLPWHYDFLRLSFYFTAILSHSPLFIHALFFGVLVLEYPVLVLGIFICPTIGHFLSELIIHMSLDPQIYIFS